MKLCYFVCLFVCVCVHRGETFELIKKIKNFLHPTTSSTTVETPVLPDYEKERDYAVETTSTSYTWGEESENERSSSTTCKTGEDTYLDSIQPNEDEFGSATSSTPPPSNYEDNNSDKYVTTDSAVSETGRYPGIRTTTTSSNLDYDNSQPAANEGELSAVPTGTGYTPSAARPTGTYIPQNQFQGASAGQAISSTTPTHPSRHYSQVNPTVPTGTGYSPSAARPTDTYIPQNQFQEASAGQGISSTTPTHPSRHYSMVNPTVPTGTGYSPSAARPTGTYIPQNQFQEASAGQVISSTTPTHPSRHYSQVNTTVPTFTRTTTPSTYGNSYNQQTTFNSPDNQDRPSQQPTPTSSTDDGPIVFPDSMPSSQDASHHNAGVPRQAVYFALSLTTPRNVQNFNSYPESQSYSNIGDARSSPVNKARPDRNHKHQTPKGYNDLADSRQIVDYSVKSTTTPAINDIRHSSRNLSPKSNENQYESVASSTTRTPKKSHVPVDGGRHIIDAAQKDCGPGKRPDNNGTCRIIERK